MRLSEVHRRADHRGRRRADRGAARRGLVFGPAVPLGLAQGRPRPHAWPTSPSTPPARGSRGPGGKARGPHGVRRRRLQPRPPDWLWPAGRAPPPLQARYLSGLYPLAEMGRLLRRQAAHVGMERAELWVALTDGGSGLEDFCRAELQPAGPGGDPGLLPRGRLPEELARALHPQDEEAGAAASGAVVPAAQGGRGGGDAGGAAGVGLAGATQCRRCGSSGRRCEEYFENNVHRMEYPEYQAEGWQIGSGVVESACKTVVGQRLKGAGMRWGEAGAHALCHVRALYRSEKGQWEAFWSGDLNQNKLPAIQPMLTRGFTTENGAPLSLLSVATSTRANRQTSWKVL